MNFAFISSREDNLHCPEKNTRYQTRNSLKIQNSFSLARAQEFLKMTCALVTTKAEWGMNMKLYVNVLPRRCNPRNI